MSLCPLLFVSAGVLGCDGDATTELVDAADVESIAADVEIIAADVDTRDEGASGGSDGGGALGDIGADIGEPDGGDEAPCAEDTACPADHYCDVERGACLVGCRILAEGSCPEGQTCDRDSNTCIEAEISCAQHSGCPGHMYCAPEPSVCREGCRDDEGEGAEPNDTTEEAYRIPLPPRAGEPITYTVEGRAFCGDDPDFFQIDLERAERVRVELRYAEAAGGDLNLRLHGDGVGEVPIEATDQTASKIITFPPEGAEPRDAGGYFIEVFGQVSGRVEYALRLTLTDAGDACTPDAYEEGVGNNTAEHAVTGLGERFSLQGTICDGDEDWFAIDMGFDYGLSLEVTAPAGGAPLIIDVYSAEGLQWGLENTEYRVDAPEARPEGDVYALLVGDGAGAFSHDTYYIRVYSAEAGGLIEPYSLDVTVQSSCCCVDDSLEPNDDLNTAAPLEDALHLPGGLDFDEIYSLERQVICRGNADYYTLQVGEHDTIEAWIVGGDVVGDLRVELRDETWTPVGTDAGLSPSAEEPELARLRDTRAGAYFVVVRGVNASAGDYTLFVRRGHLCCNACSADVYEIDIARNDTHAAAQDLEDVSDGQGLRFEYNEGYLCDLEGPDEDWYRFPVAEPSSRVCVTVDGFRGAYSDVDVEMYSEAPAGGLVVDACPDDASCRAPGSCPTPDDPQGACGGFCIEGACARPVATSAGELDHEMIDLRHGVVGDDTSDRLLRVLRHGGDTSYRVSATVTPQRDLCPADWRERDAENNFDNPTPLGSGQAALCDAWLCDREDEDGYLITVPPGEDRTILIHFARLSDGDMDLLLFNPADDDFALYVGALEADFQCINVRGLDVEQEIIIVVSRVGEPRDDGDARIDYSLRVVESDLEASDVGACWALGAPHLAACPADADDPDHHGDGAPCYPTADYARLF